MLAGRKGDPCASDGRGRRCPRPALKSALNAPGELARQVAQFLSCFFFFEGRALCFFGQWRPPKSLLQVLGSSLGQS